MHGLQTVADIGQRAAHDHAHRVVEIGLPHLVFEIDRQDFARDFVHGRRGQNGRNSIMQARRNACFDARFVRLRGYTSAPMRPRKSKDRRYFARKRPAEIAKFDAAAHRFWDVDGEFKPLHELNPVRARYVAGARESARRARARRRLRRRLARRIAGARGRHGHGHRPRARA